ncbi:MAG: DUF4386 family protein [Gammaproteobacteria bacterium]
MSYKKIGGLAALVEAVAYILGIAIFIFVLDSSGYDGPVRKVEFLKDNQTSLHLTMTAVYIIFSLVLVVLAMSLFEHLKRGAPFLMQIATAFGLIWSGLVVSSGMIFIMGMEGVIDLYAADPERAATVWQSIAPVQDAVGGGMELLGGVWVLLVSVAALKGGQLPKLLNYLGIVIGTSGVLTVLPMRELTIAVFGLGQIIWFIWLGIALLIEPESN